MGKKRSFGVITYGTLLTLFSLYNSYDLSRDIIWRVKRLMDPTISDKWIGVLSSRTLSFLIYIVLLIIGINILRLKEWARKTLILASIVLTTIVAIDIIKDYISPQPEGMNIFPIWFNVGLLIIIFSPLIYFTRPKVKAMFK